MANTAEQESVIRLSRSVVTRLAPEELTLFDAVLDAYMTNPSARRPTPRGRDQILGIGVDATAALFTPIVVAVVIDVTKHLSIQASDATVRSGRSLIRRIVHRLPHKTHADESTRDHTTPITADQITLVREAALKKALALGLGKNKASLLADAIVGSLATFPIA